jgi:predicted metal-dependent phosphoesterase TrpH
MSSGVSDAPRVRMDMHVHTHRSFDCLSAPHSILGAIADRGIDRVVVTDHNEILGALEMRALDPVRVLVGEEVKTREGFDVIGILLHELIPKDTPARETCERIRAQGGIVYLPHPFDGSRAGSPEVLDSLVDLVDVVEVHNARCWPTSLNERARDWAARNAKLMGAGSDAHTLAEIGRGFVDVPAFDATRESLLAALAAGRASGRSTSPLYRLASTWAKVWKRLPRSTSRGTRGGAGSRTTDEAARG